MNRLKRTAAIRLNLFFALLLLPALLLSACSDSRYEAGRGGASVEVRAGAAGTQRLCISLADYAGGIDPDNLRAVLSLCGPDEASLKGGISAGEEIPVPLYSDEEKAELLERNTEAQAALDYEEEPLPAEEDSETVGEDVSAEPAGADVCAEAVGEDEHDLAEADGGDCDYEQGPEADDGEDASEAVDAEESGVGFESAVPEAEAEAPETEEAREAAVLEAEAVPEEEAELQTAAQGEASVPSGEASEPAAVSFEGREHGCVYSSGIVREADNTLKLYFDIDRELFPVRLESLSLCEAFPSEAGFFRSYPLQLTVEKGGCTVEIGGNPESRAELEDGGARGLNSLKLISDSEDGSVAYDRYVYVRVTDLDAEPDQFCLFYTEGGDSTVKTVNTASYRDGILTFGRIMTEASSVTLKKIEVGSASYSASKVIELSGSAHVEILSYYDFSQRSPLEYVFKFTKPAGSYLKLKFTAGNSSRIYEKSIAGSSASYNMFSSEAVDVRVKSSYNVLVLREVQVNNRYMSCSETLTSFGPEMKSRMDLFSGYNNMSRESVSYCQSVSGVSSKPVSARLYYTKDGSTQVYTASGTYDSAAQTVNFRFSADNDVKISKIIVNSRIYTNSIALNYVKSSNTIKYANMPYAKLVVKNVKSAANWIVVTYVLYNSKTGAYSSSTYKKTAGTYSSADQTYAFSFTPSALNGIDYDTVVIKSVTLDNSVSVKDRSIAMGKTYNLLYSGLSAQNTRYAVNITNGTANVIGLKGTMEYTLPSGKSYTANGSVRYDPAAKRYVMHFDTVKTTASSIKVNRITVGNRYYASSFTMKYGQNKDASNQNEGRNTRTLGMGSGFKACSVAYTVTLTNVPSSVSGASMKWSTASGSYTSKSKYADGRIVFTPKTSADTLTAGTITAGSKKSVKTFALTPRKRTYSLSYSSQMGKNGNKWVSQTCSACYVKGDGRCKTCQGSGKVACSAFKMAGASKCFSCNDTGKMNCPACAATKKCQTCAGKGVRSVLKAVN